MKTSVYQEALSTLLVAVDNFMSESISIDGYQAAVFKAESEIVSVDEKELRALLQNHENTLELIRFTTGDKGSIIEEVGKFRDSLGRWF